jgi:hypothetical protein
MKANSNSKDQRDYLYRQAVAIPGHAEIAAGTLTGGRRYRGIVCPNPARKQRRPPAYRLTVGYGKGPAPLWAKTDDDRTRQRFDTVNKML